jgi:hypothetical protein
MERRFERDANLPAFGCDLASLEALHDEVQKSLGVDPELARTRIDITLSGEELSFESFSELTAYGGLSDTITDFYMRVGLRAMTLEQRDFTVSAKSSWSTCTCRAVSTDVAWCAGTVDIGRDFARRNRRWYWWFRGPLLATALQGIPVALLIVALQLTIVGVPMPWPRWLAMGIGVIATAAIFWRQVTLFPFVTVVVRQKESWFKRHSTEINIAAAVIAALAAVAAIFVHK